MWICQRKGCGVGFYRPSPIEIYRRWKSFEITSFCMCLPSASSIHLPLVNDKLMCTSCHAEADNDILAGYTTSIQDALQKYKLNGDINILVSAYDLCYKKTTCMSTVRFDLLALICSHYINTQDFRMALKFSRTLCEITRYLYPEYHPQVAVLELQEAKLLSYCSTESGEEYGRKMELVMRILVVAHCAGHPIYGMF